MSQLTPQVPSTDTETAEAVQRPTAGPSGNSAASGVETGHSQPASTGHSVAPAETAPVEMAPTSAATPTETADRPRLWLKLGDQLFVGTVAIAAVVLLAVHWVRLGGLTGRAVEIERLPAGWYEYSVDINSATWVEWAQFDGIGETLGRRIVEFRNTNGPFQSIDDIERVPGIGPKKLEQMRPYLRVDPVRDPAPSAGP